MKKKKSVASLKAIKSNANASRSKSPTPPLPSSSSTTSSLPTPISSSSSSLMQTSSSTLHQRSLESPLDLSEQGLLPSHAPSPLSSTFPSSSNSKGSSSSSPFPEKWELKHRNPNNNSSSHPFSGYDDEKESESSSGRSMHQKRRSFSRVGSSVNERDGGDDDRGGKGEGIWSGKDRNNFMLLVLLYLLQGIPIGLTFGTLPFLLKPKLSYSQLALFSLSTYPYSLKLLWSPIVDACFWPKVGRRKSWIIPVQGLIGCAMWWLGGRVDGWIAEEVPSVPFLTLIFVTLIFFAATQDIAVDGWALTLLSQENLSYASTAQTIGLNSGYFLSFTVFLAFNSVEFGNKYFRSTPLETPLITLGGYLHFWSIIYLAVTLWVFRFSKEDPVSEDDPDMDIKKVYKVMYSIVKLKHIQSFIIIHLISKIGFMANDSVTSLKLLEKGFLKEDMAVAVLIDFPFQIIGGWLAATWAKGKNPLNPWLAAFWFRLAFGLLSMALVYYFPSQTPIPGLYFMLVIGFTVLGSFTSTVQFVGISAFHTQIADPLIGGTYMTLLNTCSNLGGTWPKPLVLQGVDYLSKSTCRIGKDTQEILIEINECISEHGRNLCSSLGGTCHTERDGFYLVSLMCVAVGATLLVGYIVPTARRLQSLPAGAWKVSIPQ